LKLIVVVARNKKTNNKRKQFEDRLESIQGSIAANTSDDATQAHRPYAVVVGIAGW
jgi:hypothetical protein